MGWETAVAGRDGAATMGGMRELLKACFGYDEFLPLQEEIIGAVMAGRDCFALMPTGGGKSLCYQLPAMARAGLTLVVSPLIALMKDQVDALEANGLPAGFINSGQTPEEAAEAARRVRAGEIKLLYVAPERVIEPRFADFLAGLEVGLIAIDEAHCVSEWGHEFRPAYRELASLRRVSRGAPVIALTATATERVRADILSQLGLKDPGVFISSFNRPNLTYSIVPKERGVSGLLSLLGPRRGDSAIIYCGSRKATEEMAQALSERGLRAEAYHAGLEAEERRGVQDRFIRDRTPIVAATIAFGMGINKPDVRLVAHYDLPKSIESYYQETGRAGRDGLPGECVLFYSYADKSRQEYFIRQIEDPEERERARQRLEQVISLCNWTRCRRKFVLEYLGEEWPLQNCGACDNCMQPREEYDATEIAQKALSAVIRTGERFGAAYVIEVLRGGKSERIRERGHDKLSVYGIAAGQSRGELNEVMENLKGEGLLATNGGEFPTVNVTARGREFLRNRESLMLARPAGSRQEPPRRDRGQRELGVGGASAYDEGLYGELSALRREIAERRGVPAFMVFGNRVLQDMARKAPRTPGEFARVSGVGDAKLREFGEPFLACINAYLQERGLPQSAGGGESGVGGDDEGNGRPGVKADADSGVGGDDASAAAKPAARAAGESFRETGRIISRGASLEEAAAARGVSAQTILGHIERLAELGVPVQWAHLLPAARRRAAIESVFEIMGDNPLRPVWEELGGEYGYDELRLVRLARRHRGQSAPAPAPSSSGDSDPRSIFNFDR